MREIRFVRSFAAAALAAAVSSTFAQTVAPGPYYATPSWDQTIAAASRFVVLSNFNSEAVLDRETGLVWERTPARYIYSYTYVWNEAVSACQTSIIGGKGGWRLPTNTEMMSLISYDGSTYGLPAGHPFLNVPSALFWTSTYEARSGSYDRVHVVKPASPADWTSAERMTTYTARPYWCVRGGAWPGGAS